MNSWLQNDMVVRLISLAVSVVMWWSISYNSLPFKEDEYSIKIQDVKVEALFNNDDFELTKAVEKVDVNLIGNKFLLDNLPSSAYRVFVNLRGLGPGRHRNVPIQVEGLPINIRKEIHPSAVNVVLEKKVEKEVPIQVGVIGQVPEGYQVGELKVKPGKVVLKGTNSKLNKISVVKASIYLNNMKASIEKTVKPEIISEKGTISGVSIYPSTVNVVVPITPLSKKVPLSIQIEKGPPKGFAIGKIHLNQEEILVYGPKIFLDQLEVYEGNKLDLSKVTSTKTFNLPILKKQDVVKVDPEKITVTVEIVPVG